MKRYSKAIALSVLILLSLPMVAFAQEAPADPGFWDFLEGALPTWGFVLLLAVLAGINAAGKAIPDSATGIPGKIRQIAKIITMYVPNRP